MKRNLLTVVAVGAIALGGLIVLQAQAGPGGHGHAFGLQGITKQLNLTSDQQTKVQPILDQAKPQIAAIHQEAMQKMKTVMDSSLVADPSAAKPGSAAEARRHSEGASGRDECP